MTINTTTVTGIDVLPCSFIMSLYKLPALLSISALLLLGTSPLEAENDAEPDLSRLSVEIHPDRVLEKRFVGFGVEWEYEGHNRQNNIDNPVWEKHWPEMLKRVDFMRPSILRVMHDARMYSRLEDGRIVLDYDSPRMEVMYRLLDYAKSRNIPVLFGEWWLHEDYLKHYGSISDPRWSSELIVPFLIHLREKRGYTNIGYFNLINEPSPREILPGMMFDFEDWKAAIINLHTALKAAGLADKILIAGTDGPGDWNGWIERVAKDPELRECIGAYEYHIYAHLNSDKWLPSLLKGKLEKGELRPRRLLVNEHDPKGADKPFFMGEAGIADGDTGDNQSNRWSFSYGVWMADYAIQSMRAGQAGLIAWDMDDAMHTWGSYGQTGLKGWGFWNSLAGCNDYPEHDFNLRPWFYTWSLLSRLFPRGSETPEVDPTYDPACRVAAARLPDEKGLSVAVVNQDDKPRTVTIRMAGTPKTSFYEYRYFAGEQPVDQDGFPIPAGVHSNINLSEGFTVTLPGEGVVFLTTQSPDSPKTPTVVENK